jgi:hypothetical protein
MILLLLSALLVGTASGAHAQSPDAAAARQLRVFLDCTACFEEFVRSEITFVDYVRDRTEADVHLLVTSTETASGGREYTAAFIGLGPYSGVDQTLRTVTTQADPEDVVRRQLATTLRIGFLHYLARGQVPPQLAVDVTLGRKDVGAAGAGDRWNNWVFSVRGAASFDGEESSQEAEYSAAVSADRITPDWKITFGAEFEHQKERFDLDEDEPFEVERRERDLSFLVVKSLGEHWSAGARGEIESSTFANTQLTIGAAPAIEFNVFPYSAYTRRQLRILYALGTRWLRYYERTLFGLTEEARPEHELSMTFDQRERWGTLEARVEWSQFLHDLALSRLELEGDLSIRLVRGLSVFADARTSRIRNQISLPARGATPEEVLLRLRQLRSGYDYGVSFGLTYSFGSIFSSVVNPRFGR